MNFFWLLPIVVLSSFLLTWLLRHYALRHNVIDNPNARSSHSVPTPRGGGISIVLSFILFVLLLLYAGFVSVAVSLAVIISGALIALLGFLDDHGHIAARWRLLGHFVAAAWALYWLGGVPSVYLLGSAFDLGVTGQILVAIYLVWMLNLFNFMDGINGIASVEAISVCLGGALLYWLSGQIGMVTLPLLLAAAVLGFLFWNFPIAKIFMGDAGSGFLGFMLGLLSAQAVIADANLLWSWLILLGVFIVDATFTLVRRVARGDKFYEAHRSHAYQYASRRLSSHKMVTLAVLTLNVFWLLPLAVSVSLGWLDGIIALVVAYLPLLTIAYCCKAGNGDAQELQGYG